MKMADNSRRLLIENYVFLLSFFLINSNSRCITTPEATSKYISVFFRNKCQPRQFSTKVFCCIRSLHLSLLFDCVSLPLSSENCLPLNNKTPFVGFRLV